MGVPACKITNHEAIMIKRGHSGSLFRGFLDTGTAVVIKNIDVKESKNEGYYIKACIV